MKFNTLFITLQGSNNNSDLYPVFGKYTFCSQFFMCSEVSFPNFDAKTNILSDLNIVLATLSANAPVILLNTMNSGERSFPSAG